MILAPSNLIYGDVAGVLGRLWRPHLNVVPTPITITTTTTHPDEDMANDFQADVGTIASIPAVPTILDVVCRTTGMGFAAVARVTETRWIACGVKDDIAFGLRPGGELKVETTICHEIRQHRDPVVINDVAASEVYRHHQTPATYGFQSYISVPIVLPDGSFFGTLCAIDPKPRMLNTPEIISMFKLFAELIAFHLDANTRLTTSEAVLSREREVSDLREQFIAVLGHDLRNPLAAISGGTEMLLKTPLNERASRMVSVIQASAKRMSGLIDDVMDFARGRLGSGLILTRDGGTSVEPILNQVIEELRSTRGDRTIETDFALEEPVNCDRVRVAQLLSNLLGNALAHGARDQPVRVRAIARHGFFELSVSNRGEPIPPAALERLFQPFFRGSTQPSQQGLGLGLYIASEIARAHGGVIDVTSTPAETRFTFRMPIGTD
jgi:signal transduction histidine kinase